MMKGAGFMGSHRSGKTTLATQVSMETDLPLVLTQTSAVVKRLGYDLSKPMAFFDRLELQHAILDAAIQLWDNEAGVFVTDRTPLDMLGYTMADITPQCTAQEAGWFSEYENRCWEAANRFFSVIILVPPAITLVPDPEKATAPLNTAYMEHIHAVYSGLLLDERCQFARMMILRKNKDLAARVAQSTATIEKYLYGEILKELDLGVVH